MFDLWSKFHTDIVFDSGVTANLKVVAKSRFWEQGRIQTENGCVQTLWAPKKMSPKM